MGGFYIFYFLFFTFYFYFLFISLSVSYCILFFEDEEKKEEVLFFRVRVKKFYLSRMKKFYLLKVKRRRRKSCSSKKKEKSYLLGVKKSYPPEKKKKLVFRGEIEISKSKVQDDRIILSFEIEEILSFREKESRSIEAKKPCFSEEEEKTRSYFLREDLKFLKTSFEKRFLY